MAEDIVQVHLVIHGRVQGVNFRNFTLKNAERAGIFGWVKNRQDHTVEALLQGAPGKVEEMKKTLEEGPAAARVDRVEEIESEESTIYYSFQILR